VAALGSGEASSSMLLAKSCHDVDWLRYVMDRPIARVSSFGSLTHFRPENRPEGAADRCLDCAVSAGCPYAADRIYLRLQNQRGHGWPMNVLTPEPDDGSILRALRTGPYGECVYLGRNDVVDHQVVSLEFEGGATGSLTMTGFVKGGHRRTRLFGTRGSLEGDGERAEVFDFVSERTRLAEAAPAGDATVAGGHGGGDAALMDAFVAAVATGDATRIRSGALESLETHLAVFAAERARRAGSVVTV
ncbi:Gfo/Idh/MocA family oxidoreductase, partial [Nonomuraea sp. NPDC055795]